MAKFQFLLFDAGVIIHAHEIGIWEKLITKCRITVAQTVAEEEVLYWEDDNHNRHSIDLCASAEEKEIDCVEASVSQVDDFRRKFGVTYLERMDPGETESIAFLFTADKEWLFSTGDRFAYKVLAQVGLGGRGISLEEILEQVGLKHCVAYPYTKKFRQKCTLEGKQDWIMGMGLEQ